MTQGCLSEEFYSLRMCMYVCVWTSVWHGEWNSGVFVCVYHSEQYREWNPDPTQHDLLSAQSLIVLGVSETLQSGKDTLSLL